MNLFSLPLDSLQLAIVEGIEEFTKENLDFMKISIQDYSYSDRTDQDNYTLSLILKLMREPYLRNKGKYFNNANPKSVISSLIDSLSDYSYVHKVKSVDDELYRLRHGINLHLDVLNEDNLIEDFVFPSLCIIVCPFIFPEPPYFYRSH